MDQHRYVLELAARGSLPTEVDETSGIPFDVVRELVEAGHLTAIDVSTHDGRGYLEPRITLSGRRFLNTLQPKQSSSHEDLIKVLGRMRDLMVAVSTGGPRIDDVNGDYRELYSQADQMLADLGLENPVPFPDLWDWYGGWSSGDLPSYQSRRELLSEMFSPLIQHVRDHAAGRAPTRVEPTGWLKVDRAVGEARRRLAEAENEEQFQAVGLLCREVLISLGQAVYDPELHPREDGVKPSDTDAKRQLGAYIAATLDGSTHSAARKHARAAVDLAVDLQHKRTATFRQAALCLEATASVVSVIAIASGRRDPVE